MDDDTLQERLERLRRQVRERVEQGVPATTRRVIWADGALQQLRAYADRLSIPLALAATPFVRGRMWQVFNCARAEGHCRERYGRTARWLRNLAALGRGLDTLPGLERAITGEDGGPPIGRTFATLLSRVAAPESAAAWIHLARSLSIREFDEAVRHARHSRSAWPVVQRESVAEHDPCPELEPVVRDAPVLDHVNDECATTTGPNPASTGSPGLEPELAVDERTPRTEVRMYMPGPLRVAFDEGVNLHRAVSGSEVPVSDFVEALVAESMSGPAPVDVADVGTFGGGTGDAVSTEGAMGAMGAVGTEGEGSTQVSGGDTMGEVERLPLRRGRAVAEVERTLALANDHWRALDHADPTPQLHARPRDRRFERLCKTTMRLLDQLETVTTSSTPGTPAALDARLRELLRLENRVERQMGRLLDYMSAKDAWDRLQFDSLAHYGAERLAMGRRTAEERARAARVLKALPLVRASYEADHLGLEKALLVARALGPGPVNRSVEREWVRHAKEVSVKRLRDELRVVSREWLLHDSWKPRSPLSDEEWRRSIALFPGTTRRRFERLVGVAGSSRMRDSVASLELRLVEPLADDLLTVVGVRRGQLAAFARTFSAEEAATLASRLLSTEDAATFSSRALSTCDRASGLPRAGAARDLVDGSPPGAAVEATGTAALRTFSVADGESGLQRTSTARDLVVESPPTAAVDTPGTVAPRTFSVADGAPLSTPASAAPDRVTESSRTVTIDVAAVSRTPLAARTALLFQAHGREVPTWVGLMAMLEEYITTWDTAGSARPARFAAIYQRDGFRCMSPLCTSRRNLHAHHLEPRSRGGGDDPSNLITLCAFCHQRGIHGLLASLTGKAPMNNVFRVGRADVAEWFQNERRIPPPYAKAS